MTHIKAKELNEYSWTCSTYVLYLFDQGSSLIPVRREGVATPGLAEVKLFMIPEEGNVRVLNSEGENKGFEP